MHETTALLSLISRPSFRHKHPCVHTQPMQIASWPALIHRPGNHIRKAFTAVASFNSSSMPASAQVTSGGIKTVLQRQPVHKPLCDKRRYEHARLPNGVRVLVIQDSDAIYAAACANVQIGYFDDPVRLQGTSTRFKVDSIQCACMLLHLRLRCCR